MVMHPEKHLQSQWETTPQVSGRGMGARPWPSFVNSFFLGSSNCACFILRNEVISSGGEGSFTNMGTLWGLTVFLKSWTSALWIPLCSFLK